MKLNLILAGCIVGLSLAACVQEPVIEKDAVTRSSHSSQSRLPISPMSNQPEEREIQVGDGAIADAHVIPFPRPAFELAAKLEKRHAPMHSGQLAFYPSMDEIRQPSAGLNRENYADIEVNPVRKVSEDPVSTFSIDVDTGSYAVVRRYLNNGSLPPSDAVRIEELINYFNYQYPLPGDNRTPFSVATEVAPSPWSEHRHLVQIGLQGYLPQQQRHAANLVFLIDVSGSMNSPDKLPLLKNAFRLLVRQLDEQDRVTMVVYAGASGVVLEPTVGSQNADILNALDQLNAGGSTHGSAGIQLAYSMARQSFIEDGINRVILATDGDFNVGTVNHEALIDLIGQQRKKGIALTTLGFGSGNYNDHLMEQLADHGDGNYAYIDNLNEAKKVLVEQLDATLQTIARDVKIQIEWNPAQVAEYRLIGYENRILNREDFNNDKVDAGDIGAGHRVTALYEITLADSQQFRIEPLRYQHSGDSQTSAGSDELAFVRLRYKKPDVSRSSLIEQVLLRQQVRDSIQRASNNLKFATAVAAWGELLRGGEKLTGFSYADIIELARQSRGEDVHGYRSEFIKLVELSEMLDS